MPDAAEGELVYYLHIPKTAGMSLSEYLKRAAGPGRAATNLVWDHLVADPGLVTARTRVVAGHFGGLFPIWLGRWPRVLTTVRNPIARALSQINHLQRAVDNALYPLAVGRSIVEFCRHPVLYRSVNNLQSRYLASLSFARAIVPRPGDDGEAVATEKLLAPLAPRVGDGQHLFGARATAFDDALSSLDPATGLRGAALRAVDELDAVGVCERFGASLRLYARVFGWDAEVHEARINTKIAGQRSTRDLAPDELAALAECNAIDLEVYRHAWVRFQALCERHEIDCDDGEAPRASAAA